MWPCVDLALTDVSEEHIACIFRVENPRTGNWREKVAAFTVRIDSALDLYIMWI
jgi:hypothetical protein